MPTIARLAVLEKDLPAGQEYCLVIRTGFVNLLKVVLVLMAQKVVLQIQLQKMIPSFAMPDLFLWDLFELLSRHRTESSLVVRGQSVAVRLQEDLSAVLYDALILIDVPSSMVPNNVEIRQRARHYRSGEYCSRSLLPNELFPLEISRFATSQALRWGNCGFRMMPNGRKLPCLTQDVCQWHIGLKQFFDGCE